MPNKAGFEVEDVELYFRVENPAIPEGLVSRHVFPNNYHNKALRGRAFTVRPATRYRFRPNEKYSINLRFSRSGLYLIALPADLEQLSSEQTLKYRDAMPADFIQARGERKNGGNKPAYYHRVTGAVTFLGDDLSEMPQDDKPLILVLTDSNVCFVTRDVRHSKELANSGEEVLIATNWDADIFVIWRPIDEGSLLVGVHDEEGVFVQLEVERTIEDLLGITRDSNPSEIDEAVREARQANAWAWHPDKLSFRTDLTRAHKLRLTDAYQSRAEAISSAGWHAHQRYFYLQRRREVAKQAAVALGAKIKAIKAAEQTSPATNTGSSPTASERKPTLHLKPAHKAWTNAIGASCKKVRSKQVSMVASGLTLHTGCMPEQLPDDDVEAIWQFVRAGVTSEDSQLLLRFVRVELQGVEYTPVEVELPEDSPEVEADSQVETPSDETRTTSELATSWVEWLAANRLGRKEHRSETGSILAELAECSPEDLSEEERQALTKKLADEDRIESSLAKRISAKLGKSS